MTTREHVPVRHIADGVDGKVRTFLGTVVACEGEPLVAPISGRACVAFDAAVWRLVSDGGGYLAPDRTENHLPGAVVKPELHARTLRARPFVIEDATGRAFVDARGAYVRLTIDHFETVLVTGLVHRVAAAVAESAGQASIACQPTRGRTSSARRIVAPRSPIVAPPWCAPASSGRVRPARRPRPSRARSCRARGARLTSRS